MRSRALSAGRRAAARRLSALSLRSRLVLIAVALLALGLATSDTVVLGVVRGQLVQRVDQQLQRFGKPLARGLGTEGAPRPRPPRSSSSRSWLPSQYVVALAAADGSVSQQFRLPVAADDPRPLWPVMDATQLRKRMGRAFDVPSDHGGGRWRVLILPVLSQEGFPDGGPAPEGSSVQRDGSVDGAGFAAGGSLPAATGTTTAPAGVVVAASLDEVSSTIDQLRTAFLLIGGVVVALLGMAGWLAVWTGLRPLRRIEATAVEIAAGLPLSHRMPEASPRTEAGRLSTALNGMLAQIESAFAARAESEERMRRFVADASHELRTPLRAMAVRRTAVPRSLHPT